MSQIWKLVGPDGKPYTSAAPGTLSWSPQHQHPWLAVSTAPPRCAPSLEAATSPTVTSSSPKSTCWPLGTILTQDLTRIQDLKVDEVFFSDQASPTVDEAVQRLEEIQTAVRR